MVLGYPEVSIVQKRGYGAGTDGTDRIWGVCVETTKGEPFKPILVTSPDEMYAEYKTEDYAAFWGMGGQGIQVIRVTAGTPVKAVHQLHDTAATPAATITLTAKSVGSYEISIISGSNISGGNNLIIREDGLQTEYYLGVSTMADLVDKINRYSKIVDAAFVAEGNGHLETIASETILGSGAGNTAGSDGKTVTGTDKPADNGVLLNTELNRDAVTAHSLGLSKMELLDVKGVFCMSPESTVQDVYANHAIAMSSGTANKWRYAVVGASPVDNSKSAILARAAAYDNEMVLFVGQGLIHYNDNSQAIQYPPHKATIAIAGKRSYLTYGEALWGGESKKLLGYNGTQFFTETMSIVDENTTTTDLDIREYNEKGVITFTRDLSGVRIREGVTTVQPDNTTMEDEESVVSIVTEAKRNSVAAAMGMTGKNITATYKTDLEQAVGSALEDMKSNDQTLIEVSEENLDAYTVSASITPRSSQREGKVTLTLSVTPVHAARIVNATITIL